MQQQSGERAGARAAGSAGWLPEQVRGSDGAGSSAEDGLAGSWAGAIGSEDDPDLTMGFTSPYATPAQLGDRQEDRPGRANEWGETTLRLGPRTAAGLSYLCWWISGLVVYFNERENKYVRFHAVQSILLTSALTVFGVLAYLATSLLFDVSASTHQPAFQHLGFGIGLLAVFCILIMWLAPMIAAWSGEYLRLPVVSAYAERYAALPPQRFDE